MRRRPRLSERLPWYRKKDYNGNLKEAEKRELDHFRSKFQHPAASYASLPEEVQSFVSILDLENYDLKQEKALLECFLGLIICAVVIYFSLPVSGSGSIFGILAGILAGLMSALNYWRKWNSNAESKYYADSENNSSIDEAIRREWELEYLERKHKSTDPK